MIQEHGYQPSIHLLKVEEQPADTLVAATLNLVPGEPVVAIQKLFLADDKPVIFNQTYLARRLIKQPCQPDDFTMPIYQFLPKFCQQELAYAFSEIIPLIAPAWLVDRLDLPGSPSAILTLQEMSYNPDNEPILSAHSYFRDDLLRLRLIRRQSQ